MSYEEAKVSSGGDDFKTHIDAWEKHYSTNKGTMFKIGGKQIEYCWPVGAPLKDCLDGKVDDIFMRPRAQIQSQLKQRTKQGPKIWPVPGKPNPTGKEVYWSFSDPFTVEDIRQASCYLIIGKTGSGKSTMCNAFANWAWGTPYESKSRVKIIEDELSVTTLGKGVGASVTFRINAYYLKIKNGKYNDKGIVIIDTPGFADVNLRDDIYQANMYKFLSNTDMKLKGVCFTVQAGENRATPEFSYIIDMTLDFFGKDVLPNIFGMCTHASTKKPKAREFLEKEGITTYFKFDNQSVFPSENDEEAEDGSDDGNDENQALYSLAMKQYTGFYEKSSAKSAISMVDTRKVIDFKEKMRELIRLANIDVEIILSEQTNLSMYLKQLKQHAAQFTKDPSKLMIKRNKKIVEEFKSASGMVTQCNKPDCTEKSCHDECYVENKKECIMMSNGICNGCNHSVENHFNTTVYKRTRDTVEEIPATALIEEFSKGSKDLKSLIDGIIKKIEDLNTKITNAMDKSVYYSNQLDKLAMKPIGKTKLLFIEELIVIEDKKPAMQKDSQKLETLRKLKRQEEQIVNIAINKNTQLVDMKEIRDLATEVESLMKEQSSVLDKVKKKGKSFLSSMFS